MYRSPVDIYIDEWAHDLLRAIEHTQARRVVIDGLMDLQMASLDSVRFREFMYSLVQRFSRLGISLLATCETPELLSGGNCSESALSQLSDNLIVLNYYRDRSSWCRSLAVVKARASRHDSAIRQFSIGSAASVSATSLTPAKARSRREEPLTGRPGPAVAARREHAGARCGPAGRGVAPACGAVLGPGSGRGTRRPPSQRPRPRR